MVDGIYKKNWNAPILRIVSYAQEAATSGQNLMCDPNNPKLKFVNTTESHVCGIPKIPLAITVNSTTPMP
ncbi:MAG TPA: hypothetical protein VIP56_12790 [Nitrososphaeraceae archaeon]